MSPRNLAFPGLFGGCPTPPNLKGKCQRKKVAALAGFQTGPLP